MIKKGLFIIIDFYKTLKIKEKIEIIFPLIFFLIAFYFLKPSINPDDINTYLLSINDSTLTIMTLLLAFGLGVATLLYSSSSPSIKRAKELYIDDVKNRCNMPINYYQLLIIRIYYSLLLQISLLLIGLTIKVFFYTSISYIIITLEILLLLHAVIVEFKIIISMYHLMWKD